MSVSRLTGRSLNMGAHKQPERKPGTPLVPPKNTELRCKRCGGPWARSPEILCDACLEHALDELERGEALEDDLRESDRDLAW